MEQKDTLTIEFYVKGIDASTKKLREFEATRLNLQKKVNTALNNSNLSAAKGFRTQLRNLEILMKEERFRQKLFNDELLASKRLVAAEKKKQQEITDALRAQDREHTRITRKMLQFGLSIMFAGQRLKQVFQGIARDSLTTFTKLNADTEAADNSINRLSAGLEGIRYVVGDAISIALESLEGPLMNIINLVIDFVDTHPKLTAWAIIIGIILGTVIELSGSLITLAAGIVVLNSPIGFAGIGTAATAAGTAGAGAFTGMIWPILGVIAIFGVLIGLFTGQKWARTLLTTVVKVFGDIVITIVWVITKIVQFIIGSFKFTTEVIAESFKWAFNGLMGIIAPVIDWLLEKIENMINWVLDLPLVQKALSLVGLSGKRVSLGRIGDKYANNESWGDRFARATDNFVEYMQKDAFDLSKVTKAFNKGVDDTLGVGLERLFGKGEATAEKNEEAAETNLEAAQLNAQSSNNLAEVLKGLGLGGYGGGNSGSVTANIENGALVWSSVVGGSTT